MITALTIDEVLALLQKTPEQAVFDWKVDFTPPTDDDSRGEMIKDITAIANACSLSYGYIFYGVDPRRPAPLVGVTKTYDDARLQQLVNGKVEPHPQFLYYEISAGLQTVSVIQVAPSKKRPFIIRVDMGRIRKGQILIRRGSSTDGVTLADMADFFYGPNSQYFANVRANLGLEVRRQEARNAHMAELRHGMEDAEDRIWQAAGFTGKPRQPR
jgi:predicted HTH transcriptional regulator